MIKIFFAYIRYLVFRTKSGLKLYGKYPQQFYGSLLRSLLPPEIESKVQKGLIIEQNVSIQPDIEYLGRHVYIGANTRIAACKSIGDFCSISHQVNIGLVRHALDHLGTSPIFYAKRRGWVAASTFDETNHADRVEIGADVLISANSAIVTGVKIGTGAVVGAGAVVTKDVPPYAIVAGVSARIIRYRFEEPLRKQLLASRWWELPEDQLRTMYPLFSHPEKFLQALQES